MHKRQLFSFAIGMSLISAAPLVAVAQTVSIPTSHTQAFSTQVAPMLHLSSSGQASIEAVFPPLVQQASDEKVNLLGPHLYANQFGLTSTNPAAYQDLLTWNRIRKASSHPTPTLGSTHASAQTSIHTSAQVSTQKSTSPVPLSPKSKATPGPAKVTAHNTTAHKTTASSSAAVKSGAIHKTNVSSKPGAATRPAVSHSLTSTSVRGQQIATYATQFLGVPYRWGGESTAGIDCSGLIQAVYRHFNIALPRTAAEQAQVGKKVSKTSLQPGDLVFFNTTGSPYSHAGIYLGQGEFISATSSHGVVVSKLDGSQYWGPRYTGATHPFAGQSAQLS